MSLRHATWILLITFSLGVEINSDPAPTTNTPDREIFIRVNQLGYLPGDAKSAIALSRAPLATNFALIDSGSHRVVFNGSTKPVAGRWGQFDYPAELNFSAWQKPGKYFLRVGNAESPPFEIRSDI